MLNKVAASIERFNIEAQKFHFFSYKIVRLPSHLLTCIYMRAILVFYPTGLVYYNGGYARGVAALTW